MAVRDVAVSVAKSGNDRLIRILPGTRGLRDLRGGPLLSWAGAMSDTPLSDRQIKLLAVVAEGAGTGALGG